MIAPRPQTRRIAVGLALAAALTTSACAAGQVAETAQEKPTLDGTDVNIGHIALRALSVETPNAVNYPVGSDPRVSVVLVNNGANADQLISISSSDSTGWGIYKSSADLTDSPAAPGAPTGVVPTNNASAGGGLPSPGASAAANAQARVTLAPGSATAFGVPVADDRVLALLGTTKVLNPGTTVPVTFDFAKAGSKTFDVPIQISDSNTGSYHPSPEYVPSPSAPPEPQGGG